MEKEGFIYIWYDKKRKMYYLGCHWGTIDDGYICSSNRMRDAYYRRSQDFKRRIIKRNIPRDRLLNEEHKWLQMIPDEQLGEKYYNLSKKHFGHWANDQYNKLTIQEKISIKTKEAMAKPEIRAKLEKTWESNKHRVQSKEEKTKRALKLRGQKRSAETRKKMSEAQRGKTRSPLSVETKQKLSESLSGEKNPFYGKQHDPDLKKRMNAKTSATMKGRRPGSADWQIGTFWWNNGVINKRSRECPGTEWNKGKLGPCGRKKQQSI
jgi:hypothetical protein